MNKIILLLAGLLLTGMLAQAQNVKITGTVVDSLGVPVAMANVIAYGSNNSMGAFGITNTEGRYQLANLKQDSTYILKVSFLGLRQIEEKVTKIQGDMVKNFVMLDGADQLDAINIVYEMPVTIKGDTIVYNSDSFTNGTERKLEDVLKKLPGMEVSEEGDVTVEGNRVERVFINGKEFFEGDSKLATKNIPADAISKVEVLKNFNNVSQLKGIGNDQDRVAINIRLKEGKEKFWFGEVTAAGGYGNEEARYQVKPKAFYYSPDVSINILTDFNNLGLPAFTFSDYRRFTGRNFSNTRGIGSSINTGTGNQGITAFQSNRAVNIESKFGAFNGAYKVNKSLDINGFAIVSSTDTEDRRDNNRTFIDNGIIEDTRDLSFQRNETAIFKLGADYKPNSNFTLDYNGQVNITDVEQISDFLSARVEPVDGGGTQSIVEDIDQLNSQRPIVIDQNLSMYYTAGDRSIFSFEGSYVDQEEDPFYNAIRDIRDQQDPEPFNGRLNLTQADPYNINQSNLVDTKRLDAKVDYWYILNKISNINLTVGGIFNKQDYNSNIFQILGGDTRNDLTDPDLINNVEYNYTDLYAGLHYKIITGKFTITPGFHYHNITTKDEQNGETNEIKTSKILPDLDIRYAFKSSESLNFTYDQTIAFQDVERYAQALVFGNYNSLSSGNNQLEGAINDEVRLNYRNFNMFNYTTIFANVFYNKNRDAIQNSTILDGINQISAPINSAFANESFGGNGSYGREFGKIRTRIGANVNYSSFNNIFNGRQLESTNFTHAYNISAGSNWQEGINFDVSYRISFQDTDNGTFQNQFTTQAIGLDANWKIGKAIQLVAEYDLNLFDADQGGQNFDFLEASAFYREPDSKWEYKVAATNLLNTEAIVNANFGQVATSVSQDFVLPRYVYLQVRYDL
ncbi:carboxypeptidase regulatory-like domain-containing protein [Nonlabens marinus]|uniref:TonB-dependent receptor n=1 Tax=Nonlabens marinus S1-08 TaxID=1454201 RepID=W8VW70_9FLAO|nr:carboxypeptidase regulatory-like domain-containing protein [Nonlabens marinus]BAO54492.1 hypothetical protein NMS_0483 [Nonlabens marinus S1-08]